MGIKIISKKIDLSDTLELREQDGKTVISAMGRSSQFSESQDVSSIFYETYEEMAIALLEKIKNDAMERFHATDVAIVQRVGQIPLGDYSFLVSVWARRIDDAFSACKFVVEEMNSELPIWKYEVKDKPKAID